MLLTNMSTLYREKRTMGDKHTLAQTIEAGTYQYLGGQTQFGSVLPEKKILLPGIIPPGII